MLIMIIIIIIVGHFYFNLNSKYECTMPRLGARVAYFLQSFPPPHCLEFYGRRTFIDHEEQGEMLAVRLLLLLLLLLPPLTPSTGLHRRSPG